MWLLGAWGLSQFLLLKPVHPELPATGQSPSGSSVSSCVFRGVAGIGFLNNGASALGDSESALFACFCVWVLFCFFLCVSPICETEAVQ